MTKTDAPGTNRNDKLWHERFVDPHPSSKSAKMLKGQRKRARGRDDHERRMFPEGTTHRQAMGRPAPPPSDADELVVEEPTMNRAFRRRY